MDSKLKLLASLSARAKESGDNIKDEMNCLPIKTEFEKAKDSVCETLQNATVDMTATLFAFMVFSAVNFVCSLLLVTWAVPKSEQIGVEATLDTLAVGQSQSRIDIEAIDDHASGKGGERTEQFSSIDEDNIPEHMEFTHHVDTTSSQIKGSVRPQ